MYRTTQEQQLQHVPYMSLEEEALRARPKVVEVAAANGGVFPELCSASPVRLTVWCKSLLFHGDGYTVFDDADGRMVFRVDNYGGRGNMALMDRAGRVLLTVRRRHRKMLSLVEIWEVYKGDTDVVMKGQDDELPLLRATKDLGNSSCTVSANADDSGYRMSWSRREEWSRIYRTATDESLVAEVCRKCGGPKKKTLLDKDVLSLVVQPGMDQAIAMAMIMITNSMR